MEVREVPFSELLSAVVDNRGKTCPTGGCWHSTHRYELHSE
jgi:hypothetical protein